MDWASLEAAIPYIPQDGPAGHHDLHSERIEVYAPGSFRVDVSLPGKHWRETEPKGGDFVIEVTSAEARTLSGSTWTARQFRHTDLFLDTEEKRRFDSEFVQTILARSLVEVVAEGADPLAFADAMDVSSTGLEPMAYLMVSQTLSLCEHRRYGVHEPTGGRCLPLRMTLGIMFGHWSDGPASQVWRQGKRGLNSLRQRNGREPTLQSVLKRPLKSNVCNE